MMCTPTATPRQPPTWCGSGGLRWVQILPIRTGCGQTPPHCRVSHARCCVLLTAPSPCKAARAGIGTGVKQLWRPCMSWPAPGAAPAGLTPPVLYAGFSEVERKGMPYCEPLAAACLFVRSRARLHCLLCWWRLLKGLHACRGWTSSSGSMFCRHGPVLPQGRRWGHWRHRSRLPRVQRPTGGAGQCRLPS